MRVHFDYSQHEIRALAYISGDPGLKKAFLQGDDFHASVASKIWKKPINEISDSERRASKGATFSIIYGSGIKSFAVAYADGDINKAKEIMDEFFNSFPTVKMWIKGKHREVLENGFVRSIWGDPMPINIPAKALNLPDYVKEDILSGDYSSLKSINPRDREGNKELIMKINGAFRKAQNSPIQSIASNIAAESIYDVAKEIKRRKLKAVVDCFTHDSGDIDSDFSALPDILKILPVITVNNINNKYGIKVDTDYEIGVSSNSMLKIHDIDIDDNIISCKFNGKDTSLTKLRKSVEKYGGSMETTITKEKKKKKSFSELFTTNDAYSLSFGQDINYVTGDLKMVI